MQERTPTIWDKIDPTLFGSEVQTQAANTGTNGGTRRSKTRLRIVFRVLDVIGAVFWIYVVSRLFLGDVDSYFMRSYLPALGWLVDYRFLVLLFGVLLVCMVIRKHYLLALLYITFFPLIVILWKLPGNLYKGRNWNLAFGVLHVLTAGLYNFRYTVAFLAFGSLAAVLAVAGDNRGTLGTACLVSLSLLCVGLYRAIRYAIGPARFLKSQKELIDRFAKSGFVEHNVKADDLRNAASERFDKAQVDTFLQRASMSVIYHRAMYFWAYRIDEYRRSSAAIVFSAISIVWLLAMMIFGFTIANYGLYRFDSAQYVYGARPDMIKFLYYSFSSLYFSEIYDLIPRGTGALLLQILARFCGTVLFPILIVTLILSYRQSRDDRVAQDVINAIRSRGEELNNRIRAEFDMAADDVAMRLQEAGHELTYFIVLLSEQVPPDWSKRPDVIT